MRKEKQGPGDEEEVSVTWGRPSPRFLKDSSAQVNLQHIESIKQSRQECFEIIWLLLLFTSSFSFLFFSFFVLHSKPADITKS